MTHLSSNLHGPEHAFILHVHFTIMTIFIIVKLGSKINILPLSAKVCFGSSEKESKHQLQNLIAVCEFFCQCISNMSLIMQNLNTSIQ